MRLLGFILLGYACYFLALIVFDLVAVPKTFIYWLSAGLGLTFVTFILGFIKANLLQAIGYLLLGPVMLFIFVRIVPGYAFSGSEGLSNFPSIKPGDFVVAKVTNNAPERGEMIVFQRLQSTKHEYLRKRVHGIPGDTILVCDGVTYVNNYHFALDNNWQPVAFDPTKRCNSQRSRYLLGENEFFVLGDNQRNSLDSRNFGPIQLEQINQIELYTIHADSPTWGSPNVTFLTHSFVMPEC